VWAARQNAPGQRALRVYALNMAGTQELVTVYRSMDPDAEEQCREVMETLGHAHIHAVLRSDKDPGVPEGVWEVQVRGGDSARAERIIAAEPPAPEEVDPSHELDLVSIYESGTPITGEVELMGIKALLESNGIATVSNSDSVQPELPFSLAVARDQVEEARRLIAEARSAAQSETQPDE